MSLSAGDEAQALQLEAVRFVATNAPGPALEEVAGWLAYDSGTGVATINQAWPLGSDSADGLPEVVRWFQRRGLGFRVMLRPKEDSEAFAACLAAAFTEERRQPAMMARLPLGHLTVPEGVTFRELRTVEDVRAFLSVRGPSASRASDENETAFILKIREAGRMCYLVGERNGAAVATASAFLGERVMSVSNVFVVEGERRRGLGAAITAEATRGATAERAYLEASAMGEPVYRRMGFETVTWFARLAPPGQA
jgi:hypothetical protein